MFFQLVGFCTSDVADLAVISFFLLDSLVERGLVFELRRFFRFRRSAFLSLPPKDFLSVPSVSRSVLLPDLFTIVRRVLGFFPQSFFTVVRVVLFRFFSKNFSVCSSVLCFLVPVNPAALLVLVLRVVENFFLFCGHFFILEKFPNFRNFEI